MIEASFQVVQSIVGLFINMHWFLLAPGVLDLSSQLTCKWKVIRFDHFEPCIVAASADLLKPDPFKRNAEMTSFLFASARSQPFVDTRHTEAATRNAMLF